MLEKILTININGKPRKILTLQERKKSGDVTLIPKGGIFHFAGPNEILNKAGSKILESHISFHNAPKLPENVVTFTGRTVDGKITKKSLYTKALKSYNKFAFLFLNRNPNLEDAFFNISRHKQNRINIGDYDPKFFQLFYSISIANRGKVVHFDAYEDCLIKSFEFGLFNIFVMISFCMISSDLTGSIHSAETVSPNSAGLNSMPQEYPFVQNGFNEVELIKMHREKCREAVMRHIANMEFMFRGSSMPIVEQRKIFATKFFRSGIENTPDAQDHLRKCLMMLKIRGLT